LPTEDTRGSTQNNHSSQRSLFMTVGMTRQRELAKPA
jgi:hypothetical protein